MSAKIKEKSPYQVLEHVLGIKYGYASKLYSEKNQRGKKEGTKSFALKQLCDKVLADYFEGNESLLNELKDKYKNEVLVQV